MAHAEDSTDILPSFRQMLWAEKRGTSLSKRKMGAEFTSTWLPLSAGGVWSGVRLVGQTVLWLMFE